MSYLEQNIVILTNKVEISNKIEIENNIASILYFIGFLKSFIHDRKCSTSLMSMLN